MKFLIKIFNLFFLFCALLEEKLKNKILNFERVLDQNKKNNILIKILLKFDEKRSIRLINLMYRKKLFSCFESAIVTYKLVKSVDKKLIIGAKKEDELDFHAWVDEKDLIVFGNKKDLRQYKVILKI